MGAGRYVGRVGGLAVALGVGVAVLTGHGVAWAGSDGAADPGPAASTSESNATAPESPGSGSKPKKQRHNRVAKPAAEAEDGGAADDKRAGTQADDGPGDDGRAGATHDLDKANAGSQERPGGKAAKDKRVARGKRHATVPTAADDPTSGTDHDAPPAADKTVQLISAAGYQAPSSSAGNGPITPTDTDSPGTLALLAAARRETGKDSNKIPYSPTVDVDNGVITGTNNGSITSPANLELTFTAVGKTAAGGKVNLNETTGDFTFLPYTTTASPGGTDSFKVLVAENTQFDQLLAQIPVVSDLVKPILVVLHQIPVVNVVLSPLIGRSRVVTVGIDVGGLATDYGQPIAFTTTVTSFDGTPISVNYFPADGLTGQQQAPTILNGPSLATAGYTDPDQETTVFGLVPGLKPLRAAGYNVVTWDPRGEFASGGVLHLDSEDFEARDVSAIIDWVSGLSSSEYGPGPNGATDPRIGMVGGSYGGGIQLTTAGIDKRIDAIAPGIAWNTLNEALYPNDAFKTSWASLLLLSLVISGSRLDTEIYSGIATGVVFGFLTPRQQEFLSSNSPATVVGNITVPTLFLQGTVDTLFPLQQAVVNSEALGEDVPVKMIWYCGGHGQCLTMNQNQLDAQTDYLVDQTLAWMDTYVAGKTDGTPPPVDGPKFVWVDQKGNWYASNELPTTPTVFDCASGCVTGSGGTLPIVPGLGGSGPQTLAKFPVSLTAGAQSSHAINVAVPTTAETSYLVGAPQLQISYSGLGTSRNIYAQLVDDTTGLVLGNIVSPVPVILDGKNRTTTVVMSDIAYTMNPGDSLTLQIVDSATSFEDFTAFGAIWIDGIILELPTASGVLPMGVPADDLVHAV